MAHRTAASALAQAEKYWKSSLLLVQGASNLCQKADKVMQMLEAVSDGCSQCGSRWTGLENVGFVVNESGYESEWVCKTCLKEIMRKYSEKLEE